jgi:SAM-dependent methyltransferase
MKQVWPAPERNRDPILTVLRRVLPAVGRMLEIASGTGQHAEYFARQESGWQIQPSDMDPDNLVSIRAWVDESALPNLHRPLVIDVRDASWDAPTFDAIFCANMIHIAPWECALGLLAGVGRHLSEGGVFALYGPFRIAGKHTAPSNEAFHASLQSRDPSWGVRNLDDIIALAQSHGLAFVEHVAMPANNFTAIFRKLGDRP